MGVEVEVRCYSGFKRDQRPLSFTREGHTLEVSEIERTWYEEDADAPGKRKACFRVRANDGKVYALSRDETSNRWTLEA